MSCLHMQSLYYVHTRTLEYRICVSWRVLRGRGFGHGRGCAWILLRSVPRLNVNHVHVFMYTYNLL